MSETRRVVLVTGSTDGIGKETAIGLARGGAHVIVHGRTRPRVDATIEDVQAAAPDAEVDGVSFDLGSLESIKKGAAQLKELVQKLDVLICNAGIFSPERAVTGDGIELTLAVNHVGHYLLLSLLEPLLLAADPKPARVLVLASVAHTRGRIHLDDLTLQRGYTGYAAYAQSKLANVMFALSLADAYEPDKLVAYAIHPGVVATKLLRQGFGPVPGAAPSSAAKAIVELAIAEPLPAPSGAYFSDGVLAQPAPAALDEATRRALWQESARLARIE